MVDQTEIEFLNHYFQQLPDLSFQLSIGMIANSNADHVVMLS